MNVIVHDLIPSRNGCGSRLRRYQRIRRLFDRVRVAQGIRPLGELTRGELARVDRLLRRAS